jgi:hypothetical protein
MVDEKGLSSQDKRMAWVLVELDIHDQADGDFGIGMARTDNASKTGLLRDTFPLRCSHCRQWDISG